MNADALENDGKRPADNKELKHLNILLVEDDETSVLYMDILLRDKCASMKVAHTGEEAIRIMQEHPEIDLVLMDVRMPDIDGYTVTRKIRKINSTVIIIAQTAFAMERDRIKAIEAGCNGYISKPIRENELLATITSFL